MNGGGRGVAANRVAAPLVFPGMPFHRSAASRSRDARDGCLPRIDPAARCAARVEREPNVERKSARATRCKVPPDFARATVCRADAIGLPLIGPGWRSARARSRNCARPADKRKRT